MYVLGTCLETQNAIGFIVIPGLQREIYDSIHTVALYRLDPCLGGWYEEGSQSSCD